MSKLRNSINNIVRNKRFGGVIVDVIGTYASVKIAGTSRVLSGLSYIGQKPVPGQSVFVDYTNGKPFIDCGNTVPDSYTLPASVAYAKPSNVDESTSTATSSLEAHVADSDPHPGYALETMPYDQHFGWAAGGSETAVDLFSNAGALQVNKEVRIGAVTGVIGCFGVRNVDDNSLAFATENYADTTNRFRIFQNGAMAWGNGTDAMDLYLYRDATTGHLVFGSSGSGYKTLGLYTDAVGAVIDAGSGTISLLSNTNKTITFPNASGTLALLETANVFTAQQSITMDNAYFLFKNTATSQYGGSGFFMYNTASSFGNNAGVYFSNTQMDTSATQSNFLINRVNYLGEYVASLLTLDVNTGFLGVNASQPISNLHVYGTGAVPNLSVNNQIFTVDNNVTQKLTIGADPNSPYGMWLQARTVGSSYPISLNPLGGNVGIGTLNPTYNLDVVSASNTILRSYTTGTTGQFAMVVAGTPAGQWGYYTAQNTGHLYFYDFTNDKFPYTIQANSPSNSFIIKSTGETVIGDASGVGTGISGVSLSTFGAFAAVASYAANLDSFVFKIVPQYAEEGMQFWYGAVKLLHTMGYNAPDILYVDLGLDVAGNTKLGAASTNTITMTGRMLVRTTASDPQHATPASRPAGTAGEVAYYSGKLYLCVNAATPVWEKITSV